MDTTKKILPIAVAGLVAVGALGATDALAADETGGTSDATTNASEATNEQNAAAENGEQEPDISLSDVTMDDNPQVSEDGSSTAVGVGVDVDADKDAVKLDSEIVKTDSAPNTAENADGSSTTTQEGSVDGYKDDENFRDTTADENEKAKEEAQEIIEGGSNGETGTGETETGAGTGETGTETGETETEAEIDGERDYDVSLTPGWYYGSYEWSEPTTVENSAEKTVTATTTCEIELQYVGTSEEAHLTLDDLKVILSDGSLMDNGNGTYTAGDGSVITITDDNSTVTEVQSFTVTVTKTTVTHTDSVSTDEDEKKDLPSGSEETESEETEDSVETLTPAQLLKEITESGAEPETTEDGQGNTVYVYKTEVDEDNQYTTYTVTYGEETKDPDLTNEQICEMLGGEGEGFSYDEKGVYLTTEKGTYLLNTDLVNLVLQNVTITKVVTNTHGGESGWIENDTDLEDNLSASDAAKQAAENDAILDALKAAGTELGANFEGKTLSDFEEAGGVYSITVEDGKTYTFTVVVSDSAPDEPTPDEEVTITSVKVNGEEVSVSSTGSTEVTSTANVTEAKVSFTETLEGSVVTVSEDGKTVHFASSVEVGSTFHDGTVTQVNDDGTIVVTKDGKTYTYSIGESEDVDVGNLTDAERDALLKKLGEGYTWDSKTGLMKGDAAVTVTGLQRVTYQYVSSYEVESTAATETSGEARPGDFSTELNLLTGKEYGNELEVQTAVRKLIGFTADEKQEVTNGSVVTGTVTQDGETYNATITTKNIVDNGVETADYEIIVETEVPLADYYDGDLSVIAKALGLTLKEDGQLYTSDDGALVNVDMENDKIIVTSTIKLTAETKPATSVESENPDDAYDADVYPTYVDGKEAFQTAVKNTDTDYKEGDKQFDVVAFYVNVSASTDAPSDDGTHKINYTDCVFLSSVTDLGVSAESGKEIHETTTAVAKWLKNHSGSTIDDLIRSLAGENPDIASLVEAGLLGSNAGIDELPDAQKLIRTVINNRSNLKYATVENILDEDGNYVETVVLKTLDQATFEANPEAFTVYFYTLNNSDSGYTTPNDQLVYVYHIDAVICDKDSGLTGTPNSQIEMYYTVTTESAAKLALTLQESKSFTDVAGKVAVTETYSSTESEEGEETEYVATGTGTGSYQSYKTWVETAGDPIVAKGTVYSGSITYSYDETPTYKYEVEGTVSAYRDIDASWTKVSTTPAPETNPGGGGGTVTPGDDDGDDDGDGDVTPDPDGDVEIEDEDTPLSDLPETTIEDEDTPLSDLPEVTIEDEDTPLSDLPEVTIEDENTPLSDLPEVTIEDEDTPLLDLPELADGLLDLEDGEVPLADVPKTGDSSASMSAMARISALGLALMAAIGLYRGKRERREGED